MHPRTTTPLAVAVTLGGLLFAAAPAHAEPLDIQAFWSAIAPRAKVITAVDDVYRKRPLREAEIRQAQRWIPPVTVQGATLGPVLAPTTALAVPATRTTVRR